MLSGSWNRRGFTRSSRPLFLSGLGARCQRICVFVPTPQRHCLEANTRPGSGTHCTLRSAGTTRRMVSTLFRSHSNSPRTSLTRDGSASQYRAKPAAPADSSSCIGRASAVCRRGCAAGAHRSVATMPALRCSPSALIDSPLTRAHRRMGISQGRTTSMEEVTDAGCNWDTSSRLAGVAPRPRSPGG